MFFLRKTPAPSSKKPATALAWENSEHFATPPMVFPHNEVWETSAEIPCWWRVSKPRSGWCFWLAEASFLRSTTNQKPYPDLGSDELSILNFCTWLSNVISRRNQWWSPETLAKIAFSVLLKLTEKNKMRHLLFLSGTVYAVYNYRYFKPWISQKSYVSSALSWKILFRVFEMLWLNILSWNLPSMFYLQQQQQ